MKAGKREMSNTVIGEATDLAEHQGSTAQWGVRKHGTRDLPHHVVVSQDLRHSGPSMTEVASQNGFKVIELH